jgi:hypothetical protein
VSASTPVDFETWFLARGWILLLACAAICVVALVVLARRAPEREDDTATCPPIDLDTELRQLIEREAQR